MNIHLAKTAGFCFGVKNAVDLAFNASKEYGDSKKVYTLGPLIHNDAVIQKLAENGVNIVENPSDVTAGDCIIIRAHGTTETVYNDLVATGATVLDATCPFVKKIHNRVQSEYKAGKKIIIIGDKEHPEVIGINGWCDNSAIVIGSLEEAENFEFTSGEYSCVVQTTFNGSSYRNIVNYLKKALDLIVFYDSICNATSCRQSEARELASNNELMIVVGSKQSSNTSRLYEICKEQCKNVYLVSSADELDLRQARNFLEVGVTAGASTPDWIIEEVLFIMDEAKSIVVTDEANGSANTAGESFQDLLDNYAVAIRTGDVKEVTVSKVEDTRVFVNLNFKYEGVIDINEFGKKEDGTPDVNVGDVVTAFVVYVNDKDCEVKLSKQHEDKHKDLKAVEEAFNNHTPLKLTITKAMEFGVIANYGTAQVYIAASHLSLKFVKNTEKFVGKEVMAVITKYEKQPKGRMKISASVKELLQAEKDAKDEAFWSKVELGKTFTGIVKDVLAYGAFVELEPGYDGLLHNTEISWKNVKNAKDLLKAGQEIEVQIASFDREKGKLSLTCKKAEEDPWFDAENKYVPGDILDVVVTKFVPYGVFVEVTPELTALVHISQISNRHIDSADQCLKIGQLVQAKVQSIDVEHKKLSLSIKAVQAYDPEPKPEDYDEEGNLIVKERKPRRNKKAEAAEGAAENAPKAERKPRAPKKAKEESFQDDVVETSTSIGDIVANLGLEFSDEQ